MDKPKLNSFILDCLRKKDIEEGWQWNTEDTFRCRLCKKIRHNKLRSRERKGYCRPCNGEV